MLFLKLISLNNISDNSCIFNKTSQTNSCFFTLLLIERLKFLTEIVDKPRPIKVGVGASAFELGFTLGMLFLPLIFNPILNFGSAEYTDHPDGLNGKNKDRGLFDVFFLEKI